MLSRKYETLPPGRISSIMRILADGRVASLMEIEEVIEYLEDKRIKAGGKPRSYAGETL